MGAQKFSMVSEKFEKQVRLRGRKKSFVVDGFLFGIYSLSDESFVPSYLQRTEDYEQSLNLMGGNQIHLHPNLIPLFNGSSIVLVKDMLLLSNFK